MSNYPPGVDDDDPYFTDENEDESTAEDELNRDQLQCSFSGTPWPANAEEAAMCTPITLWNRTLTEAP